MPFLPASASSKCAVIYVLEKYGRGYVGVGRNFDKIVPDLHIEARVKKYKSGINRLKDSTFNLQVGLCSLYRTTIFILIVF